MITANNTVTCSHPLLLLLTSFTCIMLASPAQLYMPHLFTHCLPTTICVMLMLYFFLFLWYVYYVTFLRDSCVLYLFFSFELMSNLIFRLVFLLVAILNCTNLVTLLLVIVLVVHTGFECTLKHSLMWVSFPCRFLIIHVQFTDVSNERKSEA